MENFTISTREQNDPNIGHMLNLIKMGEGGYTVEYNIRL